MAFESDEGLSNANSAWIAGFSPETKQSNNAYGFRLIRSNCGLLAQLEESSAVIHLYGLVMAEWAKGVEVDATTGVSWVIRTARSAIAVLMTSMRACFCVAMSRRRSSVVCCWDSRICCTCSSRARCRVWTPSLVSTRAPKMLRMVYGVWCSTFEGG
nr:hypothetical protein Iba_chr04bCG13210 [Ipomoea batatas]